MVNQETPHKGLVIAGSYRQFRDWCARGGDNPQQYHYVKDASDLYKVPDHVSVALVGTYYERRDWPELQDMVEVRKRRSEKLARKDDA